MASLVAASRLKSAAPCDYCRKPGIEGTDINAMGGFYRLEGHHYHYFCVLFSDGLRQYDDDGINGFRHDDIRKMLKKAANKKCKFCSLSGATSRCTASSCSIAYHFTCGRENDCTFIFKDRYNSFCPKHAPKPKASASTKGKEENEMCLAGCLSNVDDNEKFLVSPCCKKRYHTECLQNMASSSGLEHFNCPLRCNKKNAFVSECLRFGIYVPEQDAEWEMPEQQRFYNFDTMGRLPQRCNIVPCVCPKGRQHSLNGSDFEVLRCYSCGSRGAHLKCASLEKNNPAFECKRCKPDQPHSEEDDQRVDRASEQQPAPARFATSFLGHDPRAAPAASSLQPARRHVKRTREQSSSEDDDEVVLDKIRKSSVASETTSQREETLSSSDSECEILFIEEIRAPKRSPETITENVISLRNCTFPRPGHTGPSFCQSVNIPSTWIRPSQPYSSFGSILDAPLPFPFLSLPSASTSLADLSRASASSLATSIRSSPFDSNPTSNREEDIEVIVLSDDE